MYNPVIFHLKMTPFELFRLFATYMYLLDWGLMIEGVYMLSTNDLKRS